MDEHKGVDQGVGWSILSYLLSGLIFYGGLGWLADRFFHTSFWLPIGIILGAVASFYLVIKRYGQR